MPILDGFGLLQEIRKLPSGMAVPFLFLTARSEKQDVMQARNLGVDDYLTKPYQADELIEAVRSRLKRRMLTQMFDTREAHLQTIIMLANVIEARDVYTRGHVERVQQYAMELGRALNWSPEDLSMLEFGALLHDVGKVVVPELILNKPGPLNPEELEVMRSHALAGAKMLWCINYLADDMNQSYLEKIPIRTISFSDPKDKARHDKMVSLVEQMLELNKQLATAKTAHDKTILQRQIDATDKQIDSLVYELYGLAEEEIKIVESS